MRYRVQVELLVVIAVIVILAVMFLPVLLKAKFSMFVHRNPSSQECNRRSDVNPTYSSEEEVNLSEY